MNKIFADNRRLGGLITGVCAAMCLATAVNAAGHREAPGATALLAAAIGDLYAWHDDTTAASGFPNGRNLLDPVIDVTLAVALLELTGEPAPHAADALVGVLNPPANDKDFSATFPYIASLHQ